VISLERAATKFKTFKSKAINLKYYFVFGTLLRFMIENYMQLVVNVLINLQTVSFILNLIVVLV